MTRARIQVESYQPAGVPQALFLNRFRPEALRGEQLALRLAQQYRLLGSAHTPRQERWQVALSGYTYAIVAGGPEEAEIIAFHWHPERGDPDGRLVSWPHIHIGDAELRRVHLTHRRHIPSGVIAIEDVLVFLLEDLNVAPLRPDWRTIMQATRRQATQVELPPL